nr:phosphoinositide phosphatase SAC2-like isoform X2 [Tanacetum cinerariifolium]
MTEYDRFAHRGYIYGFQWRMQTMLPMVVQMYGMTLLIPPSNFGSDFPKHISSFVVCPKEMGPSMRKLNVEGKEIFSQRRGQWKATTQSREFFYNLSNAYMDAQKEDVINMLKNTKKRTKSDQNLTKRGSVAKPKKVKSSYSG